MRPSSRCTRSWFASYSVRNRSGSVVALGSIMDFANKQHAALCDISITQSKPIGTIAPLWSGCDNPPQNRAAAIVQADAEGVTKADLSGRRYPYRAAVAMLRDPALFQAAAPDFRPDQ